MCILNFSLDGLKVVITYAGKGIDFLPLLLPLAHKDSLDCRHVSNAIVLLNTHLTLVSFSMMLS